MGKHNLKFFKELFYKVYADFPAPTELPPLVLEMGNFPVPK